jgi:hypothetical protein
MIRSLSPAVTVQPPLGKFEAPLPTNAFSDCPSTNPDCLRTQGPVIRRRTKRLAEDVSNVVYMYFTDSVPSRHGSVESS